jgi:hypothetical protein
MTDDESPRYVIRHRTQALTWSFFAESEVSSVVMAVANVIREKSLQVKLIEGDDVVQQVAPTAFNPRLHDPVLPETLERCPHWTDIYRPNHNWNFQAVLGIPIEDKKSRSGLIRSGLAQVLHDPTTGGMPRNIEMYDAPTIVADDEKNNRVDRT